MGRLRLTAEMLPDLAASIERNRDLAEWSGWVAILDAHRAERCRWLTCPFCQNGWHPGEVRYA
jgi:hypothetical protein